MSKEIDLNAVIGTKGEIYDLIIINIKHHKTYCDDIENCHVYLILERAVSEMMEKDVVIKEVKK